MITDRQLTDILELSDIPAKGIMLPAQNTPKEYPKAFSPSLIRRLRLLTAIINDPGIVFRGDVATGVVVMANVGFRAVRKLVPGIPADSARLTVGQGSVIIDLYRSNLTYITSLLYTDEDLFNLVNTKQ